MLDHALSLGSAIPGSRHAATSPQVAVSGTLRLPQLSPILVLMMQLEALRTAYARLPASLRARIPPAIKDWLRAVAPAPVAGAGPVPGIETRLWGGFSRHARLELESLLHES